MSKIVIVDSAAHQFYWRFKLEAPLLVKNISFFEPSQIEEVHHRSWIVAYDDVCIRGLIALRKESGHIPNALGIGYISTHKKYLNQGIASLMVRSLFDYAKKLKKDIANTPYEPDGDIYLRHIMEREAMKHLDVTLYERDYML